MPNVNRPIKVTFRLSSEEKKRFDELQKSSGEKQQHFITSAIFNGKIKTCEEIEVEKSKIKEMAEFNYLLRKLGVNVNQIAKKMNQTGQSLSAQTIISLEKALQDVIEKAGDLYDFKSD